eukprot:TRINITY_DN3393_c0_g1_i1.p3 TRINITY_DN3393_c0_g1~~TRINITY_DN3393_c0_g1_i1.p3  ORF type:complete len:110 (-),score=17.37 TRINITY_DN3393_c0_g1_i1:34-363(-)
MGVQGFPTVLGFKDGQMFTHSGERTVLGLENWARSIIKGKATGGQPVPPEPTWKDEFRDLWKMTQKDFDVMWQQKKLVLAVVFGAGIVVGLGISSVLSLLRPAPLPKRD